jgi:hypothetical protein
MRSVFSFSVKKALDKNPSQKQLILYSSKDEFVPTIFTQKGGTLGDGRNTIDLQSNHDKDLVYNPEITPLINKFLD